MGAFFAVAAAICAVGWITKHFGCAILLWYMQEKGFPLPSDEDMKRGSRYVAEHYIMEFLEIFRQDKRK